MTVHETKLAGILLIETRRFGDERGYFYEAFQRERYADAGIPADFYQDNVSYSHAGVIRGLHFQNPEAQGKLVSVPSGEIWDVVVDIRRDSPTFGQWAGFTLSRENGHQLWIPAGFAHGFAVTGDDAVLSYKCSCGYRFDCEHTLLWDDPEVGIEWPVDLSSVIISGKDRAGKTLAELQGNLF